MLRVILKNPIKVLHWSGQPVEVALLLYMITIYQQVKSYILANSQEVGRFCNNDIPGTIK